MPIWVKCLPSVHPLDWIQKAAIWLHFHLVFLSHDNIVILSDDTNVAGGANLPPLICLLLHHHQLTSLILLHHNQMTLHVPRPFDQLALLLKLIPSFGQKHKTKVAKK